MEQGVGSGWQWQVVGLSFRGSRQPARAGPLPPLTWRVEQWGQVALTAPERKIQATRADMAALRGLVQARAGDLAGAEADWRVALAVDPGHGPANNWLK